MLVVANLLLAVCGALALLLTLTARRSGPEGPVGAHMITAPLALGLCVALAIGVPAGGWASTGLPAWPLYVALPGLFVAMTLLPILALEPRWRTWCRVAVVTAVAGSALCIDGGRLAPSTVAPCVVGAAGLLPVGVAGWWIIAAWLLQMQRNQIAAERAAAERQTEFEASQSEWQLAEWRKLPEQAELWQLIQFTHGFHPEVRAACRERIGAMPDLGERMQELLGTGWAEHALAYLRDAYPLPRGPLAPALSAFLEKERERWEDTLGRGGRQDSWFYNLQPLVEVAELVAADGGDVTACMAGWARMLRGKQGLEPLAERAARLAARG